MYLFWSPVLDQVLTLYISSTPLRLYLSIVSQYMFDYMYVLAKSSSHRFIHLVHPSTPVSAHACLCVRIVYESIHAKKTYGLGSQGPAHIVFVCALWNVFISLRVGSVCDLALGFLSVSYHSQVCGYRTRLDLSVRGDEYRTRSQDGCWVKRTVYVYVAWRQHPPTTDVLSIICTKYVCSSRHWFNYNSSYVSWCPSSIRTFMK